MWANAQPDGRPAEHRWRPLFITTQDTTTAVNTYHIDTERNVTCYVAQYQNQQEQADHLTVC